MSTSAPTFDVAPAAGSTRAVALVLPGGTADSFDPADAQQLAGLRMRPIARHLHRNASALGVAVWRVGYRVRGWNGPQMSPVHDAHAALEEVRRRHADVPVVLVGHSMGGRVAMRVAGADGVVAAMGLAPWLPDGEPVEQLRDRRVLVAHGNFDRVTSARGSRRFVERAVAAEVSASYVSVVGDTHAMLGRWWLWHTLSTAFVLDVLQLRPMSRRLQRGIDRGFL